MNFIKTIGAVIAFFLGHKTQIQGFVADAEETFPAAGSGLQKLQYVLGRVFTFADEAQLEIAKLPPEDVTAVMSGHISQVVARMFPPKAAS